MREINIILAMISIVWFSACSGNKKEADQIEQAIPVKVSEVTQNGNNQFLYASGKTESFNNANLSTRMMGFVTSVNVKVGQKVNAGQILVTINNSDLLAKKAQMDASVMQAKASYNNAKKDYERFVNLFNKQSASQKELDDMLARYEIAKAALEGAQQMNNEVKAQFAYSNIAAPFAGMVTGTFVKEGDMANPGMPLVSVEGASGMQVISMVSESDIWAIKNGMKVNVLVKSINREVGGTVSEVSLSSKNTGGQYLVKVDLDSAGKEILSGMFVNVKFPVEISSQDNATSSKVFVNKSALIKNGQLTGIYTIGNGNVAILRWLRIGKIFGNQVEVLSGLSFDEKYILSAESKLFNGAKVSF